MEEQPTHDGLPKAVHSLREEFREEIKEIKSLLFSLTNRTQSKADQWLDLVELCNYLPDKPVPQTVYRWVHEKTIPFHKAEGQKKLRFLKSDIDAWLMNGRQHTVKEIDAETDNFLSKRKRRAS